MTTDSTPQPSAVLHFATLRTSVGLVVVGLVVAVAYMDGGFGGGEFPRD
jgi:hypothetical protein